MHWLGSNKISTRMHTTIQIILSSTNNSAFTLVTHTLLITEKSDIDRAVEATKIASTKFPNNES